MTSTKTLEQNESLTCVVCQSTTNVKQCSACFSVSYCSPSHQKGHWKLHKSDCRAFKIETREDQGGGGLYTVALATRNLAQGALITDDLPFFQLVPSTSVGDVSGCLTCGVSCSGRSCSKCNWQSCTLECENFPLHADNECKIFKVNNLAIPKWSDQSKVPSSIHCQEGDISNFVGTLRALGLKTQKPEVWAKMMSCIPPRAKRQLEEKLQEIQSNAHAKGWSTCNLSQGFPKLAPPDRFVLATTDTELKTLARFCGFKQVANDDIVQKSFLRSGIHMYKTASEFQHACSPNCQWNIGNYPDFKMRIRAAIKIEAGTPLTLNRFAYEEFGKFGTLKRQEIHLETFGSPCKCALCLDPTEFGTFQSAIVCSPCRKEARRKGIKDPLLFGYLIPENPLEMDVNQSVWKCTKCHRTSSASNFIPKVNEFYVDRLEDIFINFIQIQRGPNVAINFIRENRGSFVHPNHWLLKRAFKIIRRDRFITGDPGSLSYSELEKMYKMHLALKGILDVTAPGLNLERIYLLPSIGEMIFKLYLKCFNCLAGSSLAEMVEAREWILECRKLYEDCDLYWKGTLPLRDGSRASSVRGSAEELAGCKRALAQLDDHILHASA